MRAVCLLVALFTAAIARAQEQVVVHTVDNRQICNVKLTPFVGSKRLGGFGWLLVDAQNLDQRPHSLAVQLESRPWAQNNLQVRRSVELGPEERTRFFLPLPNLRQVDLELRTQIDGAIYRDQIGATPDRDVAGLLISDRSQAQPSALAVMQAAAPTEKPALVTCSGVDVPTDWRLFTGFELVIVDGRCPLAAESQEALRRYVYAGGLVLVSAPASLPPGAVRDQLEPLALPGHTTYGLGTWVAVARLENEPAVASAQLAGLPGLKFGVWPLPQPLLLPQPVPDLGQAPVLVFLAVILCFAVLIGPVNFLLLRKWRRPMLVLVTVPALGIGTTLLMLGYGLVHDGFGVRGTIRSWTLLDQVRHEAVVVSTRTLFAGLSPASLEIGPDSLLVAPMALDDLRQRHEHHWNFDADRSVCDGAVLPSRTLTVLTTVRQGVVRDRLRVREAGDQLEILSDGGLAPVGEMLLRDLDGKYWIGKAPRLRRCLDPEALAAFDQYSRDASAHVVMQDNRPDWERVEDADTGWAQNLDPLTSRLVGKREPAVGTWLARVPRPPWLDEHGLSVAYDAAEHFVVGRLAAEDFLR